MSQLIAALKRKYASPRAVMEKLGLDFNLLKNEMMAHDQAPEDLGDPNDGDYQHNCLLRHLAKNMDNVALSEAIEMLETLLRQKATRAEDEEDQPALRKFLRSKGWGKNDIDGACKAASSAPAQDDPPPFKGMPKKGGGQDPMSEKTWCRELVAADSALARRCPGIERITVEPGPGAPEAPSYFSISDLAKRFQSTNIGQIKVMP